MPAKQYILIVEDEPEICRFIEAAMQAQGFGIECAPNGQAALKKCSAALPDLVILDLGLPDMDGKEIIKSLRAWTRVPIIVLSARDQEVEKVTALELGADDYLTKPFGMAELQARINVALRHATRREGMMEFIYTFKDLRVDLSRRKALLGTKEIYFTPTEYELLAALVRKAGQIVTQTELLREVWGKDSEDHDHYLRIYIQKLRQKLGDDPLRPRYIFTEPGVGYRLSEEKPPVAA